MKGQSLWRRVVATMVLVGLIAVLSGCPTLFGGQNGNDDATSYTVTYEANGADSGTAPEAQTKSETVDLTIATNSGNLARTGYAFLGWNTADDGSGTDYAEGATYTTDADVTLYASWEIAFVTTWQTDASGDDTASDDDQIQLPLDSDGTYDFTVWWGDGTSDQITAWNQTETLHTYGSSGTYDVTITGTIDGFGFGYDGGSGNTDADKIIDVKQWGPVILRNDSGVFMDADNLASISATDSPDLSTVTTLEDMFRHADSFNGEIGGWDISPVTRLNNMFRETPFNRDLSGWDTSAVTDMYGLFYEATLFNQDLSGWDTSAVTSMERTFMGAAAFNGDIGGWDTSSVTRMHSLFREASSFNRDISGWDTSSVTGTGMDSMFEAADAFNQNLSGWCVPLISDEPNSFDTSADAWTLADSRPVWGTCP